MIWGIAPAKNDFYVLVKPGFKQPGMYQNTRQAFVGGALEDVHPVMIVNMKVMNMNKKSAITPIIMHQF